MITRTGEGPRGISPIHHLQVSELGQPRLQVPGEPAKGPARPSDTSLTLPESGDKGSAAAHCGLVCFQRR